MKQYIKDNKIKYTNQIVINKDGFNIYNPTEEMILADGWEVYEPVIPEPQPQEPQLEPSSYAMERAVALVMMPQAKAAFKELDDQEALKVKELADTWASKINSEVQVDERLWYDNKLFKVKQKHTVLEIYPPSIDTASLYEEINELHEGTKEDPIPYNNNMRLELGKYYTQNGVIYMCHRDSEQAVYQDLADLVDIYVTVVN